MNIRNGRLLCIAQYAAPYEGNFIASLEALEAILCKEFFLDWLLPKLGYINLCLSTGLFLRAMMCVTLIQN